MKQKRIATQLNSNSFRNIWAWNSLQYEPQQILTTRTYVLSRRSSLKVPKFNHGVSCGPNASKLHSSGLLSSNLENSWHEFESQWLVLKRKSADHEKLKDYETSNFLGASNALVASVLQSKCPGGPDSIALETAATELLRLDLESKDTGIIKCLGQAQPKDLFDKISYAVFSILTNDQASISHCILEKYIALHISMRRFATFPAIFDAYASKTMQNHTRTRILRSSLYSARAAVPFKIASSALNASIEEKDLALCLNIIETTTALHAYRLSVFYRKGLIPCLGLGLSPLAAYGLGKTFSHYQERMDPEVATAMGTVGFLTYLGMTSMLGFITITTANDQMRRVSWRVGTALHERWLREDERLLVERVACAWGFKNSLRFGEEDGEDWSNLKHWIAERGMVLDNPKLLEGLD